MAQKKYYGNKNRGRMRFSEAKKKGGYPYLVLRLFKNWIKDIRTPTRSISSATDEVEWLKEQREVVRNGGIVWFAAWEYYFGYSAQKKRNKLVKLIDKQIDERCG